MYMYMYMYISSLSLQGKYNQATQDIVTIHVLYIKLTYVVRVHNCEVVWPVSVAPGAPVVSSTNVRVTLL